MRPMTKLYLTIVAIALTTLVTIGIAEEAEAQAQAVVCDVKPFFWPGWGWGTRQICCTRTWDAYGFYVDHHCRWQ